MPLLESWDLGSFLDDSQLVLNKRRGLIRPTAWTEFIRTHPAIIFLKVIGTHPVTFVYIQLWSPNQPCHKILGDLQLATDLYSKKHCPAFYVLDKSEAQSNVNQNESCLEILVNPICPPFFWIPPFLLNCSTEVVHHCTTICFNRWPLRHCFISFFGNFSSKLQ